MTILPAWIRTLGAAGAASNAAAACQRRRLEEQILDERLEALSAGEQVRLAETRPSGGDRRATRAA